MGVQGAKGPAADALGGWRARARIRPGAPGAVRAFDLSCLLLVELPAGANELEQQLELLAGIAVKQSLPSAPWVA